MSMNIKGSWKKIKRCPECESSNIVKACYKDGSEYLECEGCWQVICPIKEASDNRERDNAKREGCA